MTAIPIVHFNIEWKENEDKMSADAVEQIQEMLELADLKDVAVNE